MHRVICLFSPQLLLLLINRPRRDGMLSWHWCIAATLVIWTRNLVITSPTLYHMATSPRSEEDGDNVISVAVVGITWCWSYVILSLLLLPVVPHPTFIELLLRGLSCATWLEWVVNSLLSTQKLLFYHKLLQWYYFCVSKQLDNLSFESLKIW